MSIEKLPSGRWRGVVRHNGVKRTTRTCATKAEARTAEARLLLDMELEFGPAIRKPEAVADMTLKDLADLTLAQGKFAPTYAAEFERIIAKLPDAITKRLVSSVTPLQAVRWWQQLAADGWTANRVQKAHLVLSSALSQGVRLGIVRTNPLRDVAPPKPPAPEIVLPSANDVQRILAAIDDPAFRALVQLIVSTGVRRGEVVGLKWGDITTGERGPRVTVRRAVTYTPKSGLVVKETKTNKKGRRTIPLPPEAVDALAKWKAVQAERLTIEAVMADRFIFSETGDFPRRPDFVQMRWQKACKAAGVSCRLHELRHAFVSGLLEAGENPVRVSRLAGHARTSTTLDIYGHLLADA